MASRHGDLLERGESRKRVLQHSKLSLYQDQVSASRQGHVISLPRGDTIDFAYFLHTDVGKQPVGAR